LEQGEYLFQLAGRKPSFIRVPVGLMDAIIGFLDLLAKVFPGLEVLPALLRINWATWEAVHVQRALFHTVFLERP
jgi:hypothetical protein